MDLVFIIKFQYEMNLECLNDIISDNLVVNIDLTDLKSWDLNTGLTAFSLTKWSGAYSDNINLIDFGLTEFDNGRTNIMWSGITLTPNDTLFSMYRVGFNNVINPTTGETSGVTVTTTYLPMSATSTSGGSTNYFDLNGGYLQGFFKLDGFNYQLLPTRYNNGITIETILYLYPNSHGIFLMLGARAEDKYNPYFSGETISESTGSSGITTSFDNHLDALLPSQQIKNGFTLPEEMTRTVYTNVQPIDNLKNNVIAFEITQDKRLGVKYINANGLVVSELSPPIITTTGFTVIAIVYTPNNEIEDPELLDCAEQRLGKLVLYVNGRSVWKISEFPEFYFKPFANDKEKQIGVPYSISWGGGSFGLKHSWHYDKQTYSLYSGQDTTYINSKFIPIENPISTDCYVAPTGDTYLAGLSFSANSITFTEPDNCNPSIENPITVLQIKYTGGTGTTYFIKFNQPISVISNRDYDVEMSIFNDNFFVGDDNKITILTYSDTTDVNIVSEIQYVYPLTTKYINQIINQNTHKWLDQQEYEYSINGIMYYGTSGTMVTPENANIVGFNGQTLLISNYYSTGENAWLPIKCKFRIPDNIGQKFINIGILIESNDIFNSGGTLYIKNFTYSAADILVQDNNKNNLLIQQNFDSSFIGGIQKLRIYDRAFTSSEILNNTYWESKENPNIVVSKGGRIIYG